jgi:hypothetical protein
MAFTHGKDSDVEIYSGGSYRLMSGYVSSAGLSRAFDTAETTNLASTGKEYVAGLGDGTLSLSGMFDPTAEGYLTAIAGTVTQFYYYPEGKSNGKPRKGGDCILTSLSSESPVDGMVSMDAEFQVSGGITDDTSP